MKKLRLVLLISVISGLVSAQSKMTLGVFAGTSWYMGDLNPAHIFYEPMPAGSVIFMYNFTKRWSLRNEVSFISVHALNSTNSYYPANSTNTFSSSFFQASSRMEFNFAPFILVDRKHAFSTYVNAGLGYTLPILGSTRVNMVTFPFGVGVKYGVSKRMAIGAEWTENKTFTDKLDNIESPGGNFILHHNDWYTCFGVFILYKIFDNPENCPVYKN